jgi:integrase
MQLEEGKEPDAFLFPRKRPGSFMWEFRAKVGFHFRFHDLRHTFSTRLMEAGAEQRLRAAALGHTWITTTDRYDHVTVDHLRPYIERMEELAMQHASEKVMQETMEATNL